VNAAPPRPFQFLSNREPPDAYACAVTGFRQRGFEVEDSSAERRTAVLLRRPPPEGDGRDGWWRVELSVSADSLGRTKAVSLAGVSVRRAGPFRAPPVALESLIGEVSARCAYPP
jgi:hypothetical protein